MYKKWRKWPSALWKTLGNRIRQLVNFLFGPDSNIPEKVTRLTTELNEATQARQRVESEKERLVLATQELASGLTQTTQVLEMAEADLQTTKADLVQVTQERDTALAENEGLVAVNQKLVDELARVNALLAQLEVNYATKDNELRTRDNELRIALEELGETAEGFNELREHSLGYLAIYWKSFRGRREAVRTFVDLLADVLQVTPEEFKSFKQTDSKTALSRLRDFRQLLARLVKHKQNNSPQHEGEAT